MKRGAVLRVGAALATTAVALAACSAMIPVNISGAGTAGRDLRRRSR